MGFGIWLEFISLGSSQFMARYLIRLNTQHSPANIHEILLQPLIGFETSSPASYWSDLGLLQVRTCIKVAGRFSSCYCRDFINQISTDQIFLSDIFCSFSQCLGASLSYPREWSKEAINRWTVTNSPSAIGML